MEIRCVPTDFADIRDAVLARHRELPSPIESFLEEHIMQSRHYRIEIAGAPAGFASIHDGYLLTQFALSGPLRRYSQAAFREVRRLESVRAAYVPTSDGFFLAHALDDHRTLANQAYFFVLGDRVPQARTPSGYALAPATRSDIPSIEAATGDFFDELERRIVAEEIFLTRRDEETVGYGIFEPSQLTDAASVGMFTLESFRGQGVGTSTIRMLIGMMHERGRRPVAGCWYYNHASKRTLEKAGLVSPTRLLNISF
jgi:GNAT superfamily N-acetyltransferase